MCAHNEEHAVTQFLHLLERDIVQHPKRLQPLPAELLQRLLDLTEGMDGDPDDPIEGEVAL
jgi:hypothetical protein